MSIDSVFINFPLGTSEFRHCVHWSFRKLSYGRYVQKLYNSVSQFLALVFMRCRFCIPKARFSVLTQNSSANSRVEFVIMHCRFCIPKARFSALSFNSEQFCQSTCRVRYHALQILHSEEGFVF